MAVHLAQDAPNRENDGMRSLMMAACCAVWLGCGRAEPAVPITDETFVRVVAELRRAHMRSADGAEYAVRKEQVLSGAGVTEEEIRAWHAVRSRDLSQMARIWERVNAAIADPEEQ
jgi:hypothetical protein